MNHVLSKRHAHRRVGLLATIFALVGFVVSFTTAPPTEAAQLEDWRITSTTPGGSTVMSGQNVRLFNRTIGQSLAYGVREYGINLVWTDPAVAPNIRFVRRAGAGPVQYGELVAIRVAGGGYLRYQVRDFGINLVWSDTPVYQWRIRGGAGTVKTGQTLALFNEVEHDYMVYASRPFGINLRWFKDV